MRAGAYRFSVLTLVALLCSMPSVHAAHEDSEGDVNIDGHVVRVAARAAVPGIDFNRSDPGNCVWDVVIEDDRLPIYSGDGEGIYADTGRWFQRLCDGEPVEINGQTAFPEGGGFSIPEMREQALDALDPPNPVWSASPNGTTVPMVVQMPAWLWIAGDYWSGGFTARVETPSGRVWAEARATPTRAIWNTGDGATTVCASGGTPWTPNAATDGACTHTYRRSTAGRDGFAMSVTVEFAVEGRNAINPTWVAVGTIERTSATALVQVAEIQAIETRGP